MRYFVTGASGWIGSAATAELLMAGHQVLGLARSHEAAARVAALGADVRRGSLDDAADLRAGAETCDGVLHLAYNHDFSDMPGAARTDAAAIEAFGEVLAGSGRPLVMASGVLGLAVGRPGVEDDRPDAAVHPRIANADRTVALAEQGVRSVVVRFAPTVHGTGDHGFVPRLIHVARERGVAAFVGDGTNRWPAVHVLDAARLVRLALTDAPAGSVLHAVADEGVAARDIAAAIGRGLGLPVTSVAAGDASEHFGWIGQFFAADCPTSSARTRTLLGWEPQQSDLLSDLAQTHYFAGA